MKTLRILIPVLVLTATVLVGCGCRNSAPETMPATMPTVTTTEMITEPTTRPTTRPTTQPTTEATIEDGNGPLPQDTTAETGAAGRSGADNGTGGSITGGSVRGRMNQGD